MDVQSLAPFEKTVAGSTPFLFAQNFPGRVFKPAHPREKAFYESIHLHPQLRTLVPSYHGTLTYSPAPNDDSSSPLSSSLSSPSSSTSTTPSSTPPSTQTLPTTAPLCTNTNNNNNHNNHHITNNLQFSSPSESPSSPLTVLHSSRHQHEDLEYLVMEDLTYGFTHPCILDVKLGTTHHDIDLTLPRQHPPRQSKYLTALDLGFCLTGMQVYKKSPARYEYMDKVQGRTLTVQSVVDKLFYFFHDGCSIRADVIDKLIDRLLLVASYFQNKPAFTFRSSSLLLLYEGKLTAESVDRVEVKMIDFAHARKLPSSAEREFKDEYGYLYGTKNFINILESLKARAAQTTELSNSIDNTHQFIPTSTPTNNNNNNNNTNNNKTQHVTPTNSSTSTSTNVTPNITHTPNSYPTTTKTTTISPLSNPGEPKQC